MGKAMSLADPAVFSVECVVRASHDAESILTSDDGRLG